MRNIYLPFETRILRSMVVLALFSLLPFSGIVSAQPTGTIETETSIDVRTDEEINTHSSNGRIYTGTVDREVRDTRGNSNRSRSQYHLAWTSGIAGFCTGR